jgi:hypothetical protein
MAVMALKDWFRRPPQGGPTITPGGSIVTVHQGAYPPPRVGATERQYLAERERAYGETWGEPKEVNHELLPQIPHVDVYIYAPNGADRPFYTLVTGGMSDLPMTFPEGFRRTHGRAELLIYVREPKEEYVAMLRFLAHHPHATGGWMAPGWTMTNGDPPEPILPGSALSTFMVLEPLLLGDSMAMEGVEIEGDRVQMLWVVPITAAECAVKLEYGVGTLLKLLNQSAPRMVFDEGRPSSV